MTGRGVAGLVVGALLVAGLVAAGAALVVGARTPDRVTAPPVESLAPGASGADDFARAACVRVQLATQGIAADSSAETVRGELSAARMLAAEALRRDSAFAALSGGVAALDEAVRRDDPAAAATAVRVTRDACTAVRGGGA